MTNGRRHAFAELRPHTAATIERHLREARSFAPARKRTSLSDYDVR